MNRTRPLPLRRAASGVAVVLASMIAATSPARASSIADGTSNTIQFAVVSAALDQPHHRAVVTAAVPDALTAGSRLATVKLVTPRLGVCAFPDVCWKADAALSILYNGHAGLGMRHSVTPVVSGARAILAAAPAQAFTAPLGSDKGSVVVTKDTDASSPSVVRESRDRTQGYFQMNLDGIDVGVQVPVDEDWSA